MKQQILSLMLLLLPSMALAHEHDQVSAGAGPENHHSHLPAGGRTGLHGMVLFGSGPYFLEHIPMLSPPHDFQVIAVVELKGPDGKALEQRFSNQGFTVKPHASFSLNDYVTGRLKKFSASIHQGNFEQGGEVVVGMHNVLVEIREYKVIRQLPSQSEEKAYQLNDGKNSFESNLIRPDSNVQFIRNRETGKVIWCVQGPDFFNPC